MSESDQSHIRFRDGTSQQLRSASALDPAYVSIDERSISELLEQARQFADKGLLNVNDNDDIAGTWSEFLPRDLDLDQLAGWLDNPDRFDSDSEIREVGSRPHLALFLAFLDLLKHSQAQLNQFTRRHLEFYYRDVLRLETRPAEPDHAHVLVDLVPDQESLLLPAKTNLLAGQDSAGNDLRFRTDNDLIATHTQVAQLKTLYAEKRTIRLSDVRKDPALLPTGGSADIWQDVDHRDRRFMAMAVMSLGDPKTGDLFDMTLSTLSTECDASYDAIKKVEDDLAMSLTDFQHFIQLTRHLDPRSDFGRSEREKEFETSLRRKLNLAVNDYSDLFQEIPAVNNVFELHRRYETLQSRRDQLSEQDAKTLTDMESVIGTSLKLNVDNFQENMDFAESVIESPRSFEASLIRRIELPEDEQGTSKDYEEIFEGIAEVKNVFDLYRQHAFLVANRKVLEPTDVTTLEAMETLIRDVMQMDVTLFQIIMEIVESFDERWRQVVDMLRTAGRRKHGLSAMDDAVDLGPQHTVAERIDHLLQYTHPIEPNSRSIRRDDLVRYDQQIAFVENHFHMSADDWSYIRGVVYDNNTPARTWEWAQVYEIFEQAHRVQSMTSERNELEEIRLAKGFEHMIAAALGQPEQKEFLDLDTNDETDKRYIRDQLRLDPTTCKSIQDIAKGEAEFTPDVWKGVYRQLIEAKWRRLGTPDPRPQIDLWDNLYAASDAKLVHPDSDSAEPQSRWPTFGSGSGNSGTEPARIGLAIASPLLALAEGTRTIVLTFRFDAKTVPEHLTTLQFQVSTEKGMLPIEDSQRFFATEAIVKEHQASIAINLTVTITLQPKDPPITPLPAEFQPAPASPVLQVLLPDFVDPKSQRVTKAYRALSELDFKGVDLEVAVGMGPLGMEGSEVTESDVGLTPSALQNDEGILDPTKPFQPFGANPAVGSRLLIAHPEIVSKPLKKLDFVVDWMGIPAEGFRTYYKNYGRDIRRINFKATASWIDNGVELPLSNIGLFVRLNPDDDSRCLISVPRGDLARHGDPPASRDDDGSAAVSGDLTDSARCFQWRLLDPDFQHLRYPSLAAAKSMEMAAAIADLMARASAGETPTVKTSSKKAAKTRDTTDSIKSTVDAELYKVNPPYTPTIGRLQMHYTASETILPASRGNSCLYHLEPFGFQPIDSRDDRTEVVAESDETGASTGAPTNRFFPQFPHAGELLIGLRGFENPQNLSLLFQMADGSADPELEREPIAWSYLDSNRWLPFTERQLLEETTEGLLQTGIITLNLPSVAPSTVMPGDLYWIRGTIDGNTRSVCDAVDVHAQAVRATRLLTDQSPQELGPPLAAETISELEETLPALQAVRQPYTSFGGRDAEHPEQFYTRVSERLRHRNRALTSWDYERMVLEAFPDIYKVKCLPVGSSEDPREADLIDVIVIPDIRGKLPSDPFQPRTGADTLRRIKQFLSKHSSPLARFRIKNPRYVRLKVRAVIRFSDGCNAEYYRPRLNDELVRYLAPWAYDDGADIIFGNEIDIYRIVNFLEERPYVDFVAHIDQTLFGPDGERWKDEAATDLIYVSAGEHRIEEWSEEEYESQVFAGIGYMSIGDDFVVAKPQVNGKPSPQPSNN